MNERQLTGKLLLTNLNILLLHFYFFWTLFFTVAFYVADDKDSRVDYIILFYLGGLDFLAATFLDLLDVDCCDRFDAFDFCDDGLGCTYVTTFWQKIGKTYNF